MGTGPGTPEAALRELGYELGPPRSPTGQYVHAVSTGNLVFTAGHGPVDESGKLAMQGQIGGELTADDGCEAARLSVVSCLASLKGEIGELGRVKRVVKLLGFVNCAPDFTATPRIIDGGSELLGAVFADRGIHARSAIGTSVLPFNMPVEVEMVVEVE